VVPVRTRHGAVNNGASEDGKKKSGKICIFHQFSKGQKMKEAETESGIKEREIKKKSTIHFVQNRKEA
jgi:hypothetical protein